MWKSAGRVPSLRVLPWHLPYNRGKERQLRKKQKGSSEHGINFYGCDSREICEMRALVQYSWNMMAHGDAREGKCWGKLANGLGIQYSLHYLETCCIQHYYRWCAHLACPVVDWTDALADLNGLAHFAERRNLISARVSSHFKRSLPYNLGTYTIFAYKTEWKPVDILMDTDGYWFQANSTTLRLSSNLHENNYSNVNKGPTRCNSMQTFIHCHVTLHVSGVTHPSSGVLTLRWLMSYIYGAPILDVSRSHTTTQHSR